MSALTALVDLMLLGACLGGLWAISDGWRENRRHARWRREIEKRGEEYRR